MKDVLVMGTRGSALALAQARQTARALAELHPGLRVEERIIRTTGDNRQSAPLPEIGGKGVFTLEIEQALLSGAIDFAIHSLKDLPPAMPQGLCLAAVPRREDPCDVCIAREVGARFDGVLPRLKPGAHVGTSSLRRRAQLLHVRPDLRITDVRGNIDTRLRKMQSGEYDAIILAAAGLNRLGLQPEFAFRLPESDFVPAPGQGALAVQSRTNDAETLQLLGALDDFETRMQVESERAVVRELNAGCSTPLGALAQSRDGLLLLHACVLTLDGAHRIEAEAFGPLEDADFVGTECAASLREQGAIELLGD